MSATFGRTLGVPFARYDRDLRFWKMYADTLVVGSSRYLGKWPKMGSLSGGVACEHQMSEHPTTVTGFGCSLPTPAASDWKREDNPSQAARRSPGLTIVSVHFPTPTASDGGAGADMGKRARGSGGDDLVTSVAKIQAGTTGPCSGDTPTLFDAGSL